MNLQLTSEELNELKCILNEYKGVSDKQLDCINITNILKKIDEQCCSLEFSNK